MIIKCAELSGKSPCHILTPWLGLQDNEYQSSYMLAKFIAYQVRFRNLSLRRKSKKWEFL